MLLDMGIQGMIMIFAIHPDLPQPRIVGSVQMRCQFLGGLGIVNIRAGHQHHEQQAQGINRNMTLPSLPRHLTCLVETTLTTHLRTLDRLAVDAASTGSGRTRFTCCGVRRAAPDPFPQDVIQTLPGAILTPLGEVIIDRLPRTKLLGKRSEERRVGKECRSRWSPY